LKTNGVAVTAGTFVTVANIPNLTFLPATNGNGSPYTTFTFQVEDDGATGGLNMNLDGTPRLLTINVTAVNDGPVVTVTTPQTVLEDTPLLVAGVSVADVDLAETSANNQMLMRLTVTNGILTLNTSNGLTFTTTTNGTPPLQTIITNGPNSSTNVEFTGTLQS